MTNVTTTDIVAIDNSSTVNSINTNTQKLRDEFDKVVYKDGREELTGNLDANGKRIINLPNAVSNTEPITLNQLEDGLAQANDSDLLAEVILRIAGDAARPTSASLISSSGASLIGLLSGDNLQSIITGLTQSTAYVTVYGVTQVTTAAQNLTFCQNAINSGAKRIIFPAYIVQITGTLTVAADGQELIGSCPYLSVLKKAADTQGSLIYASGRTDVAVRNLRTDGSRSQTTDFVDSKWNVFFNNCTRPIFENSHSYGSLTDAVVIELCLDALIINSRADNNAKGGFYWSASEGGSAINCDADNNYSTSNGVVGALGSGFIVSNTWRLTLIGNRAKNNQLSQSIFTRGNKDIKLVGNTWGDRRQIRGTYGAQSLGETTSGTVHGITYDGVTKYGTDNIQFSNNTSFLPDLFSFMSEADFHGHVIDALVGTHGTTLGNVQNIRYHPGCRVSTTGVGVGFALTNLDGDTAPNGVSFNGVDFDIPSTVRIFDYSPGAVSVYLEKGSLVNGTPVGNTAIANLTVTATVGSLPTPNGSVTIANTATPTVVELLEYCAELEAKLETLLSQLRTQGIIRP